METIKVKINGMKLPISEGQRLLIMTDFASSGPVFSCGVFSHKSGPNRIALRDRLNVPFTAHVGDIVGTMEGDDDCGNDGCEACSKIALTKAAAAGTVQP